MVKLFSSFALFLSPGNRTSECFSILCQVSTNTIGSSLLSLTTQRLGIQNQRHLGFWETWLSKAPNPQKPNLGFGTSRSPSSQSGGRAVGCRQPRRNSRAVHNKMISWLIKGLMISLITCFLLLAVLLYGPSVSGKTTIRSKAYGGIDGIPEPELSVRFNSRKHPSIEPLDRHYQASTAMSAKFRSLSPTPIKIWYDDGRGGVENGHLNLGQETTTNTYQGHVFFFTDARNKNRVLARHKMVPEKTLYTIEDPDRPAPAYLKERTAEEERFMADYYNRTGRLWKHYYGPEGPRPPPKLFMWPAKQVGEVHRVISNHSFWLCDGTKEQCQSTEPVELELEVISLEPRAFVIKNFFSNYEADHIVAKAEPSMAHSSVGDTETGAFESDTRTSSNTWLPRGTSEVTETLFRRAADLIQVDHHHLTRRAGAEDLQVVHYQNGQRYDSHHDWGVSGYPESRFLTLLLYLNDRINPHAGGETSFPLCKTGPIKVHPGKGSSVLFYDLLEDGNGDELSLHASLPTLEGEKWLANFWVWDPKFNR